MGKEHTSAILGRYSLAAVAVPDQSFAFVLLDAGARIVVSPSSSGAPIVAFNSGADVTNLVVKAAPGVLHSVFGANNAAALRYVHIFNLVALPANGTAPGFTPIIVPPATNFSVVFPRGRTFATGIVIASSSTYATLTITLAADMWLSGERE